MPLLLVLLLPALAHAQTPAPPLTPADRTLLQNLRTHLLLPISKNAPWKQVTFTDRSSFVDPERGAAPTVSKFAGFLLDQTPTTFHLLDWQGLERTLPKADTTLSDQTLQQTAAALEFPPPPPRLFSDETYITNVPPPLHPGFLLAAWLDDRGDPATAAAILQKIAAADPAATLDTAPARLADHYRSAMLSAYAAPDYPAAIRIATHLASPLFENSPQKSFAAELARQLATRSDDFKTLTLPTHEEWTALQKTLSRPEQIQFLFQRLRLIVPEFYTPAAPFGGTQCARPLRRDPRQLGPIIVINPCEALQQLHLTLAEIAPLLPHLLDDTFLVGETYDLNAPPAAPIPRVREVLASLINGTASQSLILNQKLPPRYGDDDALLLLDQLDTPDLAARKDALVPLTNWINARLGQPESQWLLQSLRTVKTQGNFYSLAQRLAVLHVKQAAPILLERFDFFRAKSDDPQMSSVAMLLYHLDPAAAVPAARSWLRSDNYHLRFWAALILVHAGSGQTAEGWPELLAILKQHDNIMFVPHAFDELLASKRDDARAFARSVRHNKEIMSWVEPQEYLRRLLLAGEKDALDHELALLDGVPNPAQSSPDEVAAAIAAWRTDGYRLPADPAQRLAARKELAQWLTTQFTLIRAGKPSAIAPPTRPLFSNQWIFPPS
jgi:hypothetical protein